jgi:hypothetical protein
LAGLLTVAVLALGGAVAYFGLHDRIQGARVMAETEDVEAADPSTASTADYFKLPTESAPMNYFTESKSGCNCPKGGPSKCACCINGGKLCPRHTFMCASPDRMEECGRLKGTYRAGFSWSITTASTDTDGWGKCVAACGMSQQYREVVCIREDGLIVDDEKCEEGERPSDSKPCESTEACCSRWVTGDFGSCALGCGPSTQSRSVTCEWDGIATNAPETACNAARLCADSPQSKPDTVGQCIDYTTCNYNWDYSAWGACPAKCGSSAQQRTASCLRVGVGSMKSEVVEVSEIPTGAPNNNCVDAEKDTLSRECWQYSGCNFNHNCGDWDECPAKCGETKERSRDCWCQRTGIEGGADNLEGDLATGRPAVETKVDDSFCEGNPPKEREVCQNDHLCQYEYVVNDWNVCDPEGVACHEVVQSRDISCRRKLASGVKSEAAMHHCAAPKEDVTPGVYKIMDHSGLSVLTWSKTAGTCEDNLAFVSGAAGTGEAQLFELAAVPSAVTGTFVIRPLLVASNVRIQDSASVAPQVCDQTGQNTYYQVTLEEDGTYKVTNQLSKRWWSVTSDGQLKTTDATAGPPVQFHFAKQQAHTAWALVMSTNGDETWKYDSDLWTSDATLAEDDVYAPNRKLPSFMEKKFDRLKACFGGQRSNCIDIDFPEMWASAQALFSAGYVPITQHQASGFDAVLSPTPDNCAPYLMGFNTWDSAYPQANAGNRARFGYLASKPSDSCAAAHTAGGDVDAAIGLGIQGETDLSNEQGGVSGMAAAGAGWTGFFESVAAKDSSAVIARSAWLYVADSTEGSAGYCAGTDQMSVEPVTDSMSETYSAAQDWMGQCGGEPEMAHPLGPFYGKRTWFKGTQSPGGLEKTFKYKLTFKSATKINSISLSGTSFTGTKWVLMDVDGNELNSKEWGTGDCGECATCNVNIPGSTTAGTVFFLEETNRDGTGRLRSQLCVHAESDATVRATSCSESSSSSDDKKCYAAMDNSQQTWWEPASGDAAWLQATLGSAQQVASATLTKPTAGGIKDVSVGLVFGTRTETRTIQLPQAAGTSTHYVKPAKASKVLLTVKSTWPSSSSVASPVVGITEMAFGTRLGGHVRNGGFEYPSEPAAMSAVGSSDKQKKFAETWAAQGNVKFGHFEGQGVPTMAEGKQAIMLGKAPPVSRDSGFDGVTVMSSTETTTETGECWNGCTAPGADDDVTRCVCPAWCNGAMNRCQCTDGTAEGSANPCPRGDRGDRHPFRRLRAAAEALPPWESELSISRPVSPSGGGGGSSVSQTLGLRSGHPYVVRFLAAISGANCPSSGLNLAMQLGTNSKNVNVRSSAAADKVPCAAENGNCACTGTVFYGANGVFTKKEVTGSIQCNNANFGDPLGGVVKSCMCQSYTHQWELFEVATSAKADHAKLRFSTNAATGCSVLIDDVSVVDGGIPATYKGCTSQKGCKCTWAPLTPWPECSATCGKGKKVRVPKCLVDDSTSPIHATKCPEPLCPPKGEMELEQPCESDIGCKYEFVDASWDACAEACGESTQSRTVTCHKRKYAGDTCSVSQKQLLADHGETAISNCLAAGAVAPMPSGAGEDDYESIKTGPDAGSVPVDSCGGLRPSTSKFCQNFKTCTCTWECDNWGECAKDCGVSTKKRNCNCYRSDGTNGVDSSCCIRDAGAGATPELTATCTNYDKCNYRWHIAGNTGHSLYEPDSKCADGLINTIPGTRDVAECRNQCDKNSACRFYAYSAEGSKCKLYKACTTRTTSSGWKIYSRAVCKDIDGWTDNEGRTCAQYVSDGRCKNNKVRNEDCKYGYLGCYRNQNKRGSKRINAVDKGVKTFHECAKLAHNGGYAYFGMECPGCGKSRSAGNYHAECRLMRMSQINKQKKRSDSDCVDKDAPEPYDETGVARLGGGHSIAYYTTAMSYKNYNYQRPLFCYGPGSVGPRQNSLSVIHSMAETEGLSANEACCGCGKGF